MEKKLTIVLLLLGDYKRQIYSLDQKLKECEKLKKIVDIVVVADDPQWMTVPRLQIFKLINKDIAVKVCEAPFGIPARAMNLGLSIVQTEYVMFTLLADPLIERLKLLRDLYHQTHRSDTLLKIGAVSPTVFYVTPQLPDNSQETLPSSLNMYGWCQTTNVGFGLGSFFIPVKVLKDGGGLDENPLLRYEIERWLSLFLAKNCEMIEIGTETGAVKKLYDYPLRPRKQFQEDLAIRYATYCHGIASTQKTFSDCAEQFANDLNTEEREIYFGLTGIQASIYKRPAYKILVVGGYWEYHHNQICFFNYLERLYGTGFATYRTILEYTAPIDLVLEYNLVIFTRCHSKNALNMMKLCNDHGIPSLYMIDDNWVSIAKDHPKEGKLFDHKGEAYNNFIEALGLCKAVWLYNDLLREDVLPFTNCVKKFKISVDPLIFEVEHPRKRTDDKLYVGFSGSLRYDDMAFRALARYARRHKKKCASHISGEPK